MPLQSEAQRRYLNWRFGHEWTKKHHFAQKGKLPERVKSHQTGGVAGGPSEWYHKFVKQGLLEPPPYTIPEQEHDESEQEQEGLTNEEWAKVLAQGGYQRGGTVMPDKNYYPIGDGQYGVFDRNWKRIGTMPGSTEREKIPAFQEGGVPSYRTGTGGATPEPGSVGPYGGWHPAGFRQPGVDIPPADPNDPFGGPPQSDYGAAPAWARGINPWGYNWDMGWNPGTFTWYSPGGAGTWADPQGYPYAIPVVPGTPNPTDPYGGLHHYGPPILQHQTGGVARHEPNGERVDEGEKERRKLRGIISKYAFQTGGVTGDPTTEHQPPNIFRPPMPPLPGGVPPTPPRPPMPPTGYPPPMPPQMPPGYQQPPQMPPGYPMMQTGGTIDENGEQLPADFIPTPTPGPPMPALVHRGEVILTPEQAAHVSIDPAFKRLFKPEQLAAMGAFEATEAEGFQTGGRAGSRARARVVSSRQEAVPRHMINPETGEIGDYGYQLGDQPYGAAPPWTRQFGGNPYLGGWSPGGPAWYSPGGIPVYLDPQGVPYGIPTWVNPTDPSTLGTAHYGPGPEET